MTRYVKARHQRRGKDYYWKLPDDMETPPPGSWLLVETKTGPEIVKMRGVQDNPEFVPTASVIKVVESLEEYREYSRVPDDDHPPRHSLEAERRKWLLKGLDITPYWQGYRVGQIIQIRRGLEQGLNVAVYADPANDEGQMEKLRRQEIARLGKALKLIPEEVSKKQLKELVYGLSQGLDVTQFNDPSMSWKMMRDRRLCLKVGLQPEQLEGLTQEELHELWLNTLRSRREARKIEQKEKLEQENREQDEDMELS